MLFKLDVERTLIKKDFSPNFLEDLRESCRNYLAADSDAMKLAEVSAHDEVNEAMELGKQADFDAIMKLKIEEMVEKVMNSIKQLVEIYVEVEL